MSYSQFTLETVKQELGITLSEKMGLFAQIPEIEYSNFLKECLNEYFLNDIGKISGILSYFLESNQDR